MKRALNDEHRGYGGLYFVLTNIICAVITVISLRLSWTSQAVAMADNMAYIVSINTTVYNYINKEDPYTKVNPTLSKLDGTKYNPLNDFNQMARAAGVSTSNASTCTVTWDSHRTRIQIGQFDTILNVRVRPHNQESVIENY